MTVKKEPQGHEENDRPETGVTSAMEEEVLKGGMRNTAENVPNLAEDKATEPGSRGAPHTRSPENPAQVSRQ